MLMLKTLSLGSKTWNVIRKNWWNPERDKESEKGVGEKKERNFQHHPSGPHHDRSNNGLAQIGLAQTSLAEIGFGQIRMAKTGLAKVGLFRLSQSR